MRRAVVLLSGGQDSATCLLWARDKFDEVHAVSYDYGQRHSVELDAAREVARRVGVASHLVVDVRALGQVADSALLDDREIKHREGELPNTVVPGRNLVFLTLAAAHAHRLESRDLVTGVCQTDYSGYPDCRARFIHAAEVALGYALETQIEIHTPLMYLTKAQTVRLAERLGGLDVMRYTHTCYEGRRPACGRCPACVLRRRGFAEAGIADPLEYEE